MVICLLLVLAPLHRWLQQVAVHCAIGIAGLCGWYMFSSTHPECESILDTSQPNGTFSTHLMLPSQMEFPFYLGEEVSYRGGAIWGELERVQTNHLGPGNLQPTSFPPLFAVKNEVVCRCLELVYM